MTVPLTLIFWDVGKLESYFFLPLFNFKQLETISTPLAPPEASWLLVAPSSLSLLGPPRTDVEPKMSQVELGPHLRQRQLGQRDANLRAVEVILRPLEVSRYTRSQGPAEEPHWPTLDHFRRS